MIKCLDKGYDMGIVTAGPMYTTDNIKYFSWMPDNLYNYLKSKNFIYI